MHKLQTIAYLFTIVAFGLQDPLTRLSLTGFLI